MVHVANKSQGLTSSHLQQQGLKGVMLSTWKLRYNLSKEITYELDWGLLRKRMRGVSE